jgi:hypothetical protein
VDDESDRGNGPGRGNGLKLVERPDPRAAINDVVVQVHASGFTSGELAWSSTWTDRLRNRREGDRNWVGWLQIAFDQLPENRARAL